MTSFIISDTSSLINLHKCGVLHTLFELFKGDYICIPSEVYKEIKSGKLKREVDKYFPKPLDSVPDDQKKEIIDWGIEIAYTAIQIDSKHWNPKHHIAECCAIYHAKKAVESDKYESATVVIDDKGAWPIVQLAGAKRISSYAIIRRAREKGLLTLGETKKAISIALSKRLYNPKALKDYMDVLSAEESSTND